MLNMTSLNTTVTSSFLLNNGTNPNVTTVRPAAGGGGGSGGQPPHVTTTHDWLLMTFFLTIMLSGVAGNSLVIYVFGSKKGRKTTEVLILYLGVIDLMTSVFNPPLNIYWIAYGFQRWDFGAVGCKILPVIGPIMTTASGWVLLVFAVERYFAIVKPFSTKFESSTVAMACIGCVLFSTCMYAHYIHALTYFPDYGLCLVPEVELPEYGYPNCIFIIIRLMAFLVIFAGTNILIYRALKKNQQSFAQALLVGKLKEQRIKQSKRIMRILNVMGLVFVILVFPRELLYLIYNTSTLIHHGGTGGVQFGEYIVDLNSWLKVLHTSNSCANIFIYAYMQDSYKKQIRKILEWLGCYRYKFKRSSHAGSKTQTSTLSVSKKSSNNNNNNNNNASSRSQKFNRQSSVYRKQSLTKNGIPTAVFFKRAQEFRGNTNSNENKVELVSV